MRATRIVTGLLLPLACSGGGGGEASGGGSLEFSLSPPAAHVRAGDSGITFSIEIQSGVASAVTWSLSGPGSWVPSGALSAVYTPPASASATASAVISAAMGGQTKSSTITIDPMPSVSGWVVSMNGVPLGGTTVAADNGATATTSASGAFTIDVGKAPYALAVRADATHALIVLGLRRTDVTLVVPWESGTALGGNIAGTISGGAGLPTPAACVTRVAFGAEQGTAWSASRASDGGFVVAFPWYGPSSVQGTLHALQWMTDAQGRPASYTGAGERPVALDANTTLYGQDLALQAPQAATLSGAMSEPMGLHVDAIYPSGAEVPLLSPYSWDTWETALTFAYVTPRLSGVTFRLTGLSQWAGGAERHVYRSGLAADATNVSVHASGMPWTIAPASGATVGANGVFAWTALTSPKAMYLVSFKNTTLGLSVAVITGETQLPLAGAAQFGVTGPAGSYLWQVFATSALGSADEAAGRDGFFAATSDYQFARTGELPFTYAP